jgi:hypothetical protein
MSDYPAEWFSATFDGIAFGAGKGQRHRTEEEVAETLCPAVEPGVATIYRDHLGRKPPKLTLPVLLENGAAFADLEAKLGYPAKDLVTAQGTYVAEMDSIEGGDRFLDVPIIGTADFTVFSEAPTVAPTPPPRAGFVWAATGLLVELDANQGDPATWAFDGVIAQVDIEWGDTGTDSMVGPFGVGGLPSAFHEYAGAGDYVVTISVVGSDSQRSADNSQLVTVA